MPGEINNAEKTVRSNVKPVADPAFSKEADPAF